jgi:DNA-damage-inducible protein J
MKTEMMHTRIDPNLKQKAEAVFSAIGINTADAIRMFFAQVSLHQGLPFDVRIPNKETIKAMEDSRLNRNLEHVPMENFDRFFNV